MDDVNLLTEGDPVKGEKEILTNEEIRAVRSLLGNLSSDSDNDIYSELSPSDVTDKSGGSGPFSVTSRSPDSEDDDEKVVIGEDFNSVDTFTKNGDDNTRTVPLSKGRSSWMPGLVYTSGGVAVFKKEHVKKLWFNDGEDRGDNFITNDNIHYQVALLYMDFREWDANDDGNEITDSQVDKLYHWAPLQDNGSGEGQFDDSNSNPPPWGSSSSGPSDSELLESFNADIIILGWVISSTRFTTSDDTYPAGVITVFGERSEVRIKAAKDAVPVEIDGVHPDSPGDSSTPHVFTGKVYGRGSYRSPTIDDATIFIMGIPNGVTLYPTEPVVGVPVFHKWTDSNGDDNEEIVYEVQGIYRQLAESTQNMTSDNTDYTCKIIHADGSPLQDSSGNDITIDAVRPPGVPVPEKYTGVIARDADNKAVFFPAYTVVEPRTSDPSNPIVGQIWLRTDLTS